MTFVFFFRFQRKIGVFGVGDENVFKSTEPHL